VLVNSIRRIAFAAILLGLALAGPGVGSMTQPRGAALAARAVAIAAPPIRDSTTDPRNEDRVVPVPLARPVRLLIPALSINTAVEALGVDGSGAMETPRNLWNVGWYRAGPSPGDTGDAVIDGHVGLPGSPLVFSGLARLAIGAEVIAVLADGTQSRFSVSGLRSWPANSSPPDLFSGDGQPRLSLITCTGSYDRRNQTYADRLIVEANYLGAA
jgi:hypothetical protein